MTPRSLLLTMFLAALPACSDPGPSAPPANQTAAERGAALAAANGCTACHAPTAARGVGPGWAGIYGTMRSLQDGRSVPADEAYLARAMREPAADVVAGFDNVMIPAAVSDAQIADIIAYIRELGDADTP